MPLGQALENGRMGQRHSARKLVGALNSLAAYPGNDAPPGPACQGVRCARGGATNGDLFIGAT